VKEDEINVFTIKYAQPQLKGRRRGEAGGRGGDGESRIIVLEGQLSPNASLTMRAFRTCLKFSDSKVSCDKAPSQGQQ